MSPPKPKPDKSPSPRPKTPKITPANSKNGAPATSPTKLATALGGATTPKSVPTPTNSGLSQQKKKPELKKPEPSLLGDFLLGRPSPQRVAAQRSASKRRKTMSMDAQNVREELRQEMRAAAVRKLQQPGGVRDRVKAWQKASQAAVKAEGLPIPVAEDARSEPTEFAVNLSGDDVDEEDRMRIKWRQKPKKKPKIETVEPKGASGSDSTAKGNKKLPGKLADERSDVIIKEAQPRPELPKKRIISDDHWMKKQQKGKGPATPDQGQPIPKDFLKRTAQNPSVQKKIRDWAQRVELPPPPPPVTKRPTVKKYRHAKTGETVTVELEEDDDHHRGALSEPDMPRRKRSSSLERRRVSPKPRVPRPPPDDGIRVRPLQTRASDGGDDGIRVRPVKPARSLPDDGIRVRAASPASAESSSRSTSTSSPSSSSGQTPSDRPDSATPPRRTSPPSRRASTPPRKASSPPGRGSTPKPRARSEHSAASDDVIEVIVEPESEASSSSRSPSPPPKKRYRSPPPPKRKSPRRRGSRGGVRRKPKRRSPSPPTTATQTETTTDDRRPGPAPEKPRPAPRHAESSGEDSRPPTAVGIDDLAEIPFGFSAFSELDLPLRGHQEGTYARQSAKPKPKPQRTDSLKLVPNVLKKVVSGAMEKMQEMAHDMAEPPRPPPTGHKPARIESWLNNTVDPFVKGMPDLPPVVAPEPLRVSAPERGSKEKLVERDSRNSKEKVVERDARNSRERLVDRELPTHKERTPDISKRASVEQSRRKERPHTPPTNGEPPKTSTRSDDSDITPKRRKSPTTTPEVAAVLKRRTTPKSPTLPRRSSGPVKKPFRDVLKEAFKGESSAHKIVPMVYPSCETDVESERESEDDVEFRRSPPPQRSPDSYKRRSASPDRPSTADSYSSSEPNTRSPPQRRRRPTRGAHDLSTILSEDSREDQGPQGPQGKKDTDSVSTVSQSTVTQTPEEAFGQPTPLTREASQQSQTSQRSQKSGSLKRRLTKHSDLVSVLSLPDDGQLVPPSRSRSIKASRSLHRKPSKANDSRVKDLLEEFADDEHFYHRELKTLVDGVVPVLLNEFVHGDNADDADRKTNSLAKAVVNMGVALEKLWTYHKRAPLHDIRRLLEWLEAVSPIYNNYLDVWRLGFQDLIVNLAPPSGRIDEKDSLLNALPRNEDGDVLSYNGERVDVAYLLKRPLIRIKWMYKFLRAAVMVIKTPETEDLLKLYGNLQEKARTRHREEFARMTDEDANNTDTTRARDLRNLRPLDNIRIDQTRQVAAKDSFEMDLDHSSGQRLECQVELMHRDKVNVPSDMGDVLIRDISNKAKPWLLFPPIPRQYISARKGESPRSMIVMIRGRHNGEEWFELIKFSTAEEVQITDWLQILGSDPMPPLSRPKPRMSMSLIQISSPKADDLDIPIGEPSVIGASDDESKTPSRYHKRQASAPVTSYPPPSKHIPYSETVDIFRSQPLTPNYGIEPVPIPKPLNIGKGSAPVQPLVELGPTNRIKRRTSSPLKHEYHPSDTDSETEDSVLSDSESSSSSSDELDENDVPDTIPGYSIKQPLPQIVEESVVSDNTIAPSQSASQVGVPAPGQQTPRERPVQRFVASVSYWSNRKGIWREINTEPSRILVFPGSMEVHLLHETPGNKQAYPLQTSGTSEVDMANREAGSTVPLICLILTPVVMIRRSTALDLEVRSRVSPESRLSSIDAGMFRFRASNQDEAKVLYEAVHRSRLNNARYIQLAEEARVRSFGQPVYNDSGAGSADGTETSSRRKGIFGRKNSYRASTRAPSQHSSATTSVSATSFLRRLLGGENKSFNIGKSTVDKQSRPGSIAGSGVPGGSMYSSGYSSPGTGNDSSTPPRSASASVSGTGSHSPSRWSTGLAKPFTPGQPLEIRCHLNVQNNRWADKGDCILHISRPPPGVRQELSLYHGLEKRIIVTHATKKVSDKPLILLDAVLGSKSFSMLGTKGIMCSVWENLRDEEGNVGLAPRTGTVAGKVTKWCFQCKSVQQANWIFGMVTSEVEGLML